MAKSAFVKGKSVNDLLNLDYAEFINLGESDLRQVVQRLASAGNKRLKSLQTVIYSPAREGVSRSGGRFTTRGKNLNQLRAEYIRAKNFFEAPTSTVRGANAIKQQIIKSMAIKGVKITDETFAKIFKLYDMLRERDPTITEREWKYEVIDIIRKEVERSDLEPEEIVEILEEKLDKLYEKRKNMERGTGVSKFFDF